MNEFKSFMQKSQEDESLDKEGEGRKSKKKGESTPHVSRKRYVINWWGDYKDQPDLWWVEKQWGCYFWEEETTESRSISPHPATRHHNLKQSNVRITLRHFLLHRQSSQPEAQWVEDHMWFHQSRVRDVEWVTGLDFYQESSRPIPELLKMKTRPTAAIQRQQ